MCLIIEPHVLYVIERNSESMFIANFSGGCCKLEILEEFSYRLLYFYRIYHLHDNVKVNAR